MTDDEKKLYELMVSKAVEAAIVAIEIYNKPTIKYRIEGFVFFICNAWELMLKAKIINDFSEKDIYFKDQPSRTISLENAMNKLFTNEHDPVRRNLNQVIKLRNTCTHFIIPEYEIVYIGLLQANLNNLIRKMKEFHNIILEDHVSAPSIHLSCSCSVVDEQMIDAKYGERIIEKFRTLQSEFASEVNSSPNEKFAIQINHNLYVTKKKDEASEFIAVDKDSPNSALIITKVQDPSQTHPYSTTSLINELNNKMKQYGVGFTQGNLNDFNRVYQLKTDRTYCYENKAGEKTKLYRYSESAKEFIISILTENGIKKEEISAKMQELRATGNSKKS
jgi:hypothetical protein